MNKLKKTPVAVLKRKAWANFSKWIRLRDCNEYQAFGMVAPCFTCGRVTHYNDLQAGHFLSGRGNAVLFSEEGVHAQCKQCNLFKNGNPDQYWPKMIEKYGLEKVTEMANEKGMVKKYTAEDYKLLIERYKV